MLRRAGSVTVHHLRHVGGGRVTLRKAGVTTLDARSGVKAYMSLRLSNPYAKGAAITTGEGGVAVGGYPPTLPALAS